MIDTITDAEHEALRFPGYVPGLLRRGSPVFVGSKQEPSVAREIVPPEVSMTGWVGIHAGWLHPVTHKINLDLFDVTGRAHLAWWLARQVRHVDGGHLEPVEGVRWHRSWRGYWELHCQRADEHRRWQEVDFLPWAGDADISDRNGGPCAVWCRFVPALATLDPDDPRLLLDGSRLVDALALSMVGRHVAGLEVTR